MSLKAKLSGAKPRTAAHRLRIEDDRGPRAELAAAQASGDDGRIAAAREALDACYETLQLRAMPMAHWDDLITTHPPNDAQRQRGGWVDPLTALPQALAACVQDSDVTEMDWREYLIGGAIGPGEALALFDDLVVLHDRSPLPDLPKDLTGSPS